MLNSKFPDTLWFVVIFGMFWRISRQSVKSAYMYPINSLKVGIFLQKSNSGFQTLGGFPIPKHGSSTPPPGFRRRILFATCTDADFDFKLHVLPPRIFKRSGSSADAEIVEGVRPNQEPLSLSARIFFFPWQVELFLFYLGRLFFVFFIQGLFFCWFFYRS